MQFSRGLRDGRRGNDNDVAKQNNSAPSNLLSAAKTVTEAITATNLNAAPAPIQAHRE